MKSVDVITSAFNEELCLPELFVRLKRMSDLEKSYTFRFIIIDNGSTDKSWELVKEIQGLDKRFVGIKMSRNFSLDSAFTCGLDYAVADLAIIMTSDLQDPPEAIPLMLRQFEVGNDQVLAKITNRDSVPWIRRKLTNLFYQLASFLTEGMLPEKVSDFRLMSRRCYQAINRIRENHRFMRGFGSWVGFRTTYIEIQRPPRFAGESKWLNKPILDVISQGFKSILANSSLLLTWVGIFGVISSLVSSFVLITLIILWIAFGVPFAGFGSIIATIVLCFSVTILVLGVIAQYIALIYEEVKQRPLYIIQEIVQN
jgi:dolichol-phosphate mannosyltransferase